MFAGRRLRRGVWASILARCWASDTVAVHDSLSRRLEGFRLLQQRQQPCADDREIRVATARGKELSGAAYRTTPMAIAEQAGDRRAITHSLVARIDGAVLWDLERPLESDVGKLEFLYFDSDPEARRVFWHSSAHILGQAVEQFFQRQKNAAVFLHDGPALAESSDLGGGFFYDFVLRHLGGARSVSSDMFPELEALMADIVRSQQPFERMLVSKDDAQQLFAENPWKLDLLARIADETVTLYRCGNLVDLCRGPHVRHTGQIGALKIVRASGLSPSAASLLQQQQAPDAKAVTPSNASDNAADSMQRVYGISFPSAKELKLWEACRQEAEKRDHRTVGPAQKLFYFHPTFSPGSPFFLPHGTRILQTLMNFMREEYAKRGFEEVITPLVYDKRLWQTSGHWDHYREDMFLVVSGFEKQQQHQHHARVLAASGGTTCCAEHAHAAPADGDDSDPVFGLKPMNCPGHCLIFQSASRSYRDLPMRIADFSSLHRNELSGALSGLMRVRRFHQDDAHIFCTEEQIASEISDALQFIDDIYAVFGLTPKYRLSTRPEKYVGSLELWAKAEGALASALEGGGSSAGAARPRPFEVNVGDGAFYGPKIDVAVTDALQRSHQCATIQLDFQMPRRFGLQYVGADGSEHVPVMIHRAIFGSLERMLAILIEHTGGKWPLWLSPRQVVVCPVSEKFVAYAHRISDELKVHRFFSSVDVSNETLQKKIRNAQLEQTNYILIVGEKEQASGTVNVRSRDAGVLGERTVSEFLADLQAQAVSRR